MQTRTFSILGVIACAVIAIIGIVVLVMPFAEPIIIGMSITTIVIVSAWYLHSKYLKLEANATL